VADCTFTRNTADAVGGAVSNYLGGSPTFINCSFRFNGVVDGGPTPLGGGAFLNDSGSPTFINCLFFGNKASEGGAVVTVGYPLTFINCTFVNNEATERDAGAIFDNNGNSLIRNCILWNNKAKRQSTNEIYNSPVLPGKTDVTYSDVHGGWAGEGNIDADPLFVNTANSDLRLQTNSPCRNTGRDHPLLSSLSRENTSSSTTPTAINMGVLERATGSTNP